MIRNKLVGAGLAIAVAVFGMSVSGAALALPEVDVKTIPPIVAPDAAGALDGTVSAPGSVDTDDAAS